MVRRNTKVKENQVQENKGQENAANTFSREEIFETDETRNAAVQKQLDDANQNVQTADGNNTPEPENTENQPATTNLLDLINSQAQNVRTRNSDYTEFTSKKKLAEVLDEDQMKVINQLKNTFNFSLHKDNVYLVITLFERNDKVYRFLIVNLENWETLEVDSIKNAKKRVAEILAGDVA